VAGVFTGHAGSGKKSLFCFSFAYSHIRTFKMKTPLYLRILLGLIIGLLWGGLIARIDGGVNFTLTWIKPFGDLFVNLLKMLAVPLILTSLITGIASLRDLSKLSRIGGRTMVLFLGTAITATIIGISLTLLIKPGTHVPKEKLDSFISQFSTQAGETVNNASKIVESPLQPLVEMVPDNIFKAFSNNSLMLQVVFFSVLAGIALLKMKPEKIEPVVNLMDSLNEMFNKIVLLVMEVAPFGVFALMASLLPKITGGDTAALFQFLSALGIYAITVIIGLLILLFLVYPILYTSLSRIKYFEFFRAMRPALLMGFSTSSSNATLPVTMDRVKNHLGIPEEISDFVLPLGTTVNMDGTALYQSVAAIFVAQALGIDLSILDMLAVVLTATLAAIGAAGVPGAGMVTLVIVLESIGVPPAAGIALIIPLDRLLDMCRTVVNVAGDAVAASVIAGMEEKNRV
jgi:proton glutamate symport protein